MMEYLKVTDKPSEIGYYSGLVVRPKKHTITPHNEQLNFIYRTAYSLCVNCLQFFTGEDSQVQLPLFTG